MEVTIMSYIEDWKSEEDKKRDKVVVKRSLNFSDCIEVSDWHTELTLDIKELRKVLDLLE